MKRFHTALSGAGIWDWCSTAGRDKEPDIILAYAGDIPTTEVVASAQLLNRYAPHLSVRVVNIVDLITLYPPKLHPHGMSQRSFEELFGKEHHVVFAFHGYPGVIHQVLPGRCDHRLFHVRGYKEEGTTTTLFDMVVRNKLSRYHLCLDVTNILGIGKTGTDIAQYSKDMLEKHRLHTIEHLEDMPEVRNWTLQVSPSWFDSFPTLSNIVRC